MTNLAFDLSDDFGAGSPEPLMRARGPGSDPEAAAPGSARNALTDRSIPPRTTDSGHEPVRARDGIRIPRISIHAFCETPTATSIVQAAAADRLMSRTHVTVHLGGVRAAINLYQQEPSPSLIIVEDPTTSGAILPDLDQLAELCSAGTKVMVMGAMNDITYYRELIRRGVSEYVLMPASPVTLIGLVANVYSETATAAVGKVYAFVGARGGVGSSVVAQNVGSSIARQLRSEVVLADMDLPFGTAGLNLNLDPAQGIAQAIQDSGRLDEVLLDRLLTKCGDHFSILSAPAALGQRYDLEEGAMEPLLEVAQANVPHIVLDMPHMWTEWVKNTLVAADEIVITATPDLASLRNTKSLVAFLKQARPHDPPPKLVLNQVGMPKRPEIKLREFINAVRMEPLACVPFDARLFGAAENDGRLIADAASKSAASKAFAHIADVLARGQDPATSPKGAQGGLNLRSILKTLTQRPGKPADAGH